uniref:Uncharacterized protein n=1 Tax=Cairina moschata TaxID=8855 RepID=A0A8C3BLM5_CAIMO
MCIWEWLPFRVQGLSLREPTQSCWGAAGCSWALAPLLSSPARALPGLCAALGPWKEMVSPELLERVTVEGNGVP